MPRRFPPGFRQRALRMIEESMPEQETEYAAIRHVGAKLGVGPEMLRKSVAVPRSIPANGRV